MKPLWLSLAGSDAETLFSGLFRKFFCHASRDYFAGLSAAKETHLDGKVVPAYLLHIKDLAIALRYGKSIWIFLANWSFDHFQLLKIHSFSDPMFNIVSKKGLNIFDISIGSFLSEKLMQLKKVFQITILSKKMCISCLLLWTGNTNFLLRIVEYFFEAHQIFWKKSYLIVWIICFCVLF